MADIELVIKLSEKNYEHIKRLDIFWAEKGLSIMTQALLNGTPLPKKHGRLIDADALDESLEKEQEDLDLDDKLTNAFSDGLTWASEVLSKEPTIIETNTESEV